MVSAKQPGAVHCYGGWCHRVSTLEEMQGIVGRRGILKASYYDDCRRDRFNTCGLTSSGAVFEPDAADNAASPIFPDGSILLAFNPQTGLAAVVRVNSAGPYHGNRTLDVSRATAEALGFKQRGLADLTIVVLKSPDAEEARYKKLRTYPKVPGFLGRFATFEGAHDEAVRRMGLMQSVVITASAVPDGTETFMPAPVAGGVRSLPPVEITAVSLDVQQTLQPRLADEVIGQRVPKLRTIAARTLAIAAPPSAGALARVSAFIETARLAAMSSASRTPNPQASTQPPALPLAKRFWTFVAEARRQARPAAVETAAAGIAVSALGDEP